MIATTEPTPSTRAVPAKKRRPHLTHHQEHSLRAKLRRTTPSEPWVEAQFKTGEEISGPGSSTAYRYHDPHAFPPGGTLHTAMIRCPKCGIFMPPNAFEAGACLDHASHEGWGPSPSAIAIQRLQMLHLRLSLPELPPEDTASLQREIDEYERKRNHSEKCLENRKRRKGKGLRLKSANPVSW